MVRLASAAIVLCAIVMSLTLAIRSAEHIADGAKAAVLTSELLSEVYDSKIRLVEIEGHYLAYH